MLEHFAEFGQGLLPDAELRARRRAQLTAPDGAPPAANLTARAARGAGVTAALWAGDNRPLTQRWAADLRGAGWLALYHGIQHDPAGQLRAVTLFDRAGQHPPYGDADGWRHTKHTLHDDPQLIRSLAGYGIHVTRSDPQLPVVDLDRSGLV